MRIWSLSARGGKKTSTYLHFKRVCVLAGSTARTINSSGEMCLRSSIGHNTQTPQQKKKKKKKDDAQTTGLPPTCAHERNKKTSLSSLG